MKRFSWYEENITFLKYALIVVNIFFMVIAIKSVVNNQNIMESIESVKQDTQNIEQKTFYINNFLAPYLKSDFAWYFFAHENNQIFPWEKIIKITTLDPVQVVLWTGISIMSGQQTIPSRSNPSQWNIYIEQLFDSVRFGTITFPFLK